MLADFEALDSWLAIRCGTAQPLPEGFKARAGRADPTNMLVRERVPKNSIDLDGLRIALTYLNSADEESTRTIKIRRAWLTSDDGYITAFCELRQAPRCFAFRNMLELVDLGTGEVFRDPNKYFEDLGVHLGVKDPIELEMWESIRDGVRVLASLAIADGQVFSDEI